MDTHEVRQGYQDLFQRWNWDLFLTLTFNSRVRMERAEKKVRILFKLIKETCKVKFAALFLFAKVEQGSFHIHALIVFDKSFNKNLDLTDFQTFFLNYLATHWKGQCSLSEYEGLSDRRIPKYLSKEKNISLFNPDNWDFGIYRKNLLERLRNH